MVPAQAVPPAVLLADGQLTITSWSCRQQEVLLAAAAAEQRGESLADWLTTIVRIGVAAAAAGGTGADIGRVERAVELLRDGMTRHVDAALDKLTGSVETSVAATDARLSRAAGEAVDRLSQGVSQIVLRPDGLLPTAIQKSVNDVAASTLGEIHRLLQSSTADLRSTVHQDREAIRAQITAIVQQNHREVTEGLHVLRSALQQQAAVAAAEARNSRKGLVYERAAARAISEIAARAGDASGGFVGGTPAAGPEKDGDVLVTLRSLPAPHPRLTAEAKCQVKPISLDGWVDLIDAAKARRGAQVGLGLTKREMMPVDDPLVVLGPDKMLVAWDPDGHDGDDLLRACYLLLRLNAAVGLRGSNQIPPEVLQRRLGELHGALTGFDKLTKHLSTARGAMDKAVQSAGEVKDDFDRRITQLLDELVADEPAA
jgi:hypothetical protein